MHFANHRSLSKRTAELSPGGGRCDALYGLKLPEPLRLPLTLSFLVAGLLLALTCELSLELPVSFRALGMFDLSDAVLLCLALLAYCFCSLERLLTQKFGFSVQNSLLPQAVI